MIINKFIPTTAIFLGLILSGCGQTGNVTNPQPSPTTVVTNNSNLSFSKVTGAREGVLNNLITSTSKASGSSVANPVQPQTGAPVANTGSSDSATGSSGIAYPGYYSNYFPQYGNFDQYVIINYEEAKKDGFKGTFQTVLNQVVKPIVASLASDYRLVSSNGNTNDAGTNIATGADQLVNGFSTNQWQFTYVSASKKEVYNILVSDKETLIIKQTWGILNLNTDEIKTDSNAAIQIIKNAVKNKDFISPDNTAINSANTQVLYDLPDNTNWYFYLSNVNGALVWNINFNLPYSTAPGVASGAPVAIAPNGSSGGSTSSSTGTVTPGTTTVISPYYYGGYAQIDAKTGNILSLTRPMNYGNISSPIPVPADIKQ